jgi:hypothetical protein
MPGGCDNSTHWEAACANCISQFCGESLRGEFIKKIGNRESTYSRIKVGIDFLEHAKGEAKAYIQSYEITTKGDAPRAVP